MTDISHAILPSLAGYAWRAVEPQNSHDAASLAALTAAADKADDNEILIVPVQRPSDLAQIDLRDIPTVSAVTDGGDIAGIGWITFDEGAEEIVATLHGCVHPAHRRKGIGSGLLAWAEAAARERVAGQPKPLRLFIRNETLSDDARRIVARQGFDTLFVELLMRRKMSDPLPDHPMPEGITVRTWTDALIPEFFAMYSASFAERPGFPNWSQAQWVDWVAGGDDFSPEYSWLACEGDQPLGFLVSDIDPAGMPVRAGWITQLGTIPAAQGKGIGAALLAKAMEAYRGLGLDYIALTVNDNNPKAKWLYRKVGMDVMRYRGKYEKRV